MQGEGLMEVSTTLIRPSCNTVTPFESNDDPIWAGMETDSPWSPCSLSLCSELKPWT